MRTYTGNVLFLFLLAGLSSCSSNTAKGSPSQSPPYRGQGVTLQSSVTQNGITWTFDGNYTVGRFYLGDWWVIGPVTISAISPAWDGQRNGSMIDPDASTDTQGYRAGLDVQYVDSLNAATLLPLTIDPGQSSQGVVSLISSVGLDNILIGGSHEGIRSAAVLTVVGSAPPSDAFRPAYARGDKTIYRTSQMNTHLLPGLNPPGSISGALGGYGNAFTKVYLDHASHGGNWGASLHPVDNGYPYGRDFSTAVSNATLVALTNNGKAVEFARRLTQMGIDFYPMWLVNNKGVEGGGFGWGYKWTILFAGIMLNHDGMMHPPLYRTGTIHKFPEDRFTSYGAPAPGWPGGKPLWGTVDPEYNECPPDLAANADCNDGYRICCSSFTWVGQALAARLMGAVDLWNHPAYFDYVDRWVGEPDSWDSGDTALYGFGGQFVRDMWVTYRN
jgi:hypothetical protein